MTVINTRFRVDEKINGSWRVLRDLPSNNVDAAESHYDKLRNDHQECEFRLVQTETRVVRSGRGRVYL